MQPTVFVSYCREKREDVRRLVDVLEEYEVTVWWDQNQKAGDIWMERITKNISSNDFFLLCLSTELEKNIDSFVFNELKQAISVKHTQSTEGNWIIPVMLDSLNLDHIPSFRIDAKQELKDIHWMPLFGKSWDDGIDEILRLILPDFTIRPKMVLIPPLNYSNPTDGEASIRPFLIGKYPVTLGEWRAVIKTDPNSTIKKMRPCGGDPNHPVAQISWDDVRRFLFILNHNEPGERYRLPTEAEWEFACRAGSTGDYGFEGGPSRLSEYAWYEGNSEGKTHCVGQCLPNAWGLFDMHGNVCEWVQDTIETPPRTKTHSGLEAVTKGGSFDGYAEEHCQITDRTELTTIATHPNLGFRLARNVECS